MINYGENDIAEIDYGQDDDPVAGRIGLLDPAEEKGFQEWYGYWAEKAGINPNPDDPRHKYDYRAAYQAGVAPEINPEDGLYHWPSEFKALDHPNRFVNGVDTITGKPVPVDYKKDWTIADLWDQEKRMQDILDISEETGIPIPDVDDYYGRMTAPPKGMIQIGAAPTPSTWEQFKHFFQGDNPFPANLQPEDMDRIEKFYYGGKLIIDAPLRVFAKYMQGRTLNLPDLFIAGLKKITPEDFWADEARDMNFEEMVDWAAGYNPSGFAKMVGGFAEFAGRLQTIAPLAIKTGLLGRAPKDIGVLGKALETAKLFGAGATVEQIGKLISEKIDPSETEYGYEGPVAVLRDMAVGAAFSIAHSGGRALWKKLTPTEEARALKLLGLQKGTSTDEIRRAAQQMAFKYHPDKVEGLRTEFERVIKARDTLIKGKQPDIVFRGQKVKFEPKLLPGEVAQPTGVKPTQIVRKAPSVPVAGQTAATGAEVALKVYHGTDQPITIDQLKSQPSDYAFGGALGEGIYFGQKPETAEFYGKNVLETEITPKNPLVISPESENYRIAPEIEELYNQTGGYDSVLMGERMIPFDVKIGDTWHEVRDAESLYQIGALAKEAGHDAVVMEGIREGATINEEILVLDESIIKGKKPTAGAEAALAEQAGKGEEEPITTEEKNILREKGYELSQILNMTSEDARGLVDEIRRIEEPEPPSRGARAGGFLGLPFETPSPEVLREGAERIYQNLINRFASIENITEKAKKLGLEIKPGEDPTLRAREYLGLGLKVESVLRDKTFRITPDGNIEITGEGLKPILDDFDRNVKVFESNRNKRQSDWKDYLIATRTVEDLQRKAYEAAEREIVTPEQVAEAQGILRALEEKYSVEGMEILKASAQRLYDYQKRILNLLVDAGNLSQRRYDQIVRLNQHYIPFDRVMEDEFGGGIPRSTKRFTEARAPVKRIKGSDLEIHDPIESTIKNTYRIMEAAERNTVARAVAQIGKVLPDDISPVRIKMVPIRIDPKEILTVAKTFRTESSRVIDEVKTIRTEGGERADISRPIEKLEKVVTDALTHRGFSKGEANAFIAQIRKGKAEPGGLTTETIKQVIKETQQVIISEQPVESTIFRASQFKPKGQVIEYFVGGKRKYIEVPKNLYEAMTGLNETGAGMIASILGKPAHWLRVGATITPEFMARNPIRDQYTALMQTGFSFVPFVDSMGAIADIVGKTELYYDWLRSGGAYAGFVELSRPALEKAVRQLTMPTYRKLLSYLNIISDAQDLSQLFEQATRVGVYKAAIRSGKTPVEAGFEAREATIDFARRGAKMADVNKAIPFFNAGLQGVDKSIRTTIKNPYSTALKGFLAITVPSILLYLHNRDDDEYKEIPRWQKDLFWVFKLRGIWWRVPKPFLYGQVFGSLPERLMEYIDTKNPNAWRDFKQTLMESISPISGDQTGGLLPTAIKPLIENGSGPGGWNYFLQRELVPESKQELAPPEQYGRYTSETAKQLGEWINYSPAKIENLIRGYFGGTGTYALQGTDYLVNAIKGQEIPSRPTEAADIPLIKGFTIRNPVGPMAQSISDFYDDSEKIIALNNSYNSIKNQDSKRAQQFKIEHPEIRIAGKLEDYRRSMSDLSKRLDAVIKSKLPDEAKRQKLIELDRHRLRTAIQGNKLMREQHSQ